VVWELFPASQETNIRTWQLTADREPFTRVKGATFINLDFVNTKISADVPEVKVRRIGAPTFDVHTCRLAVARSLRCACPARGSDQGMQV
jgi:hypothetical protein